MRANLLSIGAGMEPMVLAAGTNSVEVSGLGVGMVLVPGVAGAVRK